MQNSIISLSDPAEHAINNPELGQNRTDIDSYVASISPHAKKYISPKLILNLDLTKSLLAIIYFTVFQSL